MGKIVINAVAGSGKTSFIIDELNENDNILIITYTRANQQIIKNRIINKFGYAPSNISLYGLYGFLFSFCLRPLYNAKLEGISFDIPNRYANDINVSKFIYSNRMTKFLLANYSDLFLNRIDKYFDVLYVDEMQDFGSYDFDWLLTLSKLKIPVYLIGDFYQHTFSTSHNGNKGKSTYADFKIFNTSLENYGYEVDLSSLAASRRCTALVCKFVEEKCGINITTCTDRCGEVTFVKDLQQIKDIFENDEIVKLFYQEHYKYRGNTNNWGNSKGETYKEVCVILNPETLKHFNNNTLNDKLAKTTLHKFYVACTRSLGNVYLISNEDVPADFKILTKK